MKNLFLTLLFVTSSISIAIAQDIPTCNTSTIRYHLNEVIYFEGIVSDVRQPYVKGEPTFFSIGDKYPNQDVTIVIWGKDHNKSISYFKKFEGTRIRVKGKSYLYRGKPSIKIVDIDDIKIFR